MVPALRFAHVSTQHWYLPQSQRFCTLQWLKSAFPSLSSYPVCPSAPGSTTFSTSCLWKHLFSSNVEQTTMVFFHPPPQMGALLHVASVCHKYWSRRRRRTRTKKKKKSSSLNNNNKLIPPLTSIQPLKRLISERNEQPRRWEPFWDCAPWRAG